MAANKFVISVLADGKISTESVGGFDATTHKSADDFLAALQELTGGTFIVKKNLPKPHEHKTESHHSH